MPISLVCVLARTVASSWLRFGLDGSRRSRITAHGREHRGREGGEVRIAQKRHDLLKLCLADETRLNRGLVYLPEISLLQICSGASTRKGADSSGALHLGASTFTQ